MSHPTWVRGLKCQYQEAGLNPALVAPHVGAWIEICARTRTRAFGSVAPHVGAWIEIDHHVVGGRKHRKSHPTWVRGLKLGCRSRAVSDLGRTPRGCVD